MDAITPTTGFEVLSYVKRRHAGKKETDAVANGSPGYMRERSALPGCTVPDSNR